MGSCCLTSTIPRTVTNLVGTGDGRIVEVQGTGEKVAFDRTQMDALLDLGQAGIEQLVALQREVTGYEG